MPFFCQCPHYTGEGCEGVRSSPVLRAMPDFAGDHCRAQRPFRAIVGRLDPKVRQKTQQVATVVMPAQFIEQPLIIGISQAAVA
jgi:hypothetical protein